MNEVNPLKVRSVVEPALKSKQHKILTQALVLDSGANIHIFDNPNFLSDIITSIARAINATSSSVVYDRGSLLKSITNFIEI